MFIQKLTLMLLLVMPLANLQASAPTTSKQNKGSGVLLNQDNFYPKTPSEACQECCHQGTSAADVLRAVQVLLNNGILGLPSLQAQLVAQLQPLIIASGVVVGPPGPQGFTGATGATGPAGSSGGVIGFSDFYALMPPDNAAPVAVGSPVDFPQDGPTSGLITRLGANTFNLPNIGFYEVLFQVSANSNSGGGQLILTLNGADLAYTVVGRATGSTQIVGMAIVQTTTINSVLSVVNPSGNAEALIIVPSAGGNSPVSAHLVIKQIR